MPIKFRCSCGKGYKARDELAGKVKTCSACGRKFRVPSPDGSPTESESTPDVKPGDSAGLATAADAGPAASKASGKKRTGYILLLEDNQTIARIWAKFLEKSGHRVVLVTRGDEVLPKIQAEQPDVALLDLMVPGLSGFEVIEALRADPETADLPVCIISALSERDYQARAKELGVKCCFVKSSLKLAELAKAIDSILREAKERDG